MSRATKSKAQRMAENMLADDCKRLGDKKAQELAFTLGFALCYPGWHSFAHDGTQHVVGWLAQRGYVQCNQFGQFRATHPDGESITESFND